MLSSLTSIALARGSLRTVLNARQLSRWPRARSAISSSHVQAQHLRTFASGPPRTTPDATSSAELSPPLAPSNPYLPSPSQIHVIPFAHQQPEARSHLLEVAARLNNGSASCPKVVSLKPIYLPAWSVDWSWRAALNGPDEWANMPTKGSSSLKQVGSQVGLTVGQKGYYFPGASLFPHSHLPLHSLLPVLPSTLPNHGTSDLKLQDGEPITTLEFDLSPLVLPPWIQEFFTTGYPNNPGVSNPRLFRSFEHFRAVPVYVPVYEATVSAGKGQEDVRLVMEAVSPELDECHVFHVSSPSASSAATLTSLSGPLTGITHPFPSVQPLPEPVRLALPPQTSWSLLERGLRAQGSTYFDAEQKRFRPRAEAELASWREDGADAVEKLRSLTAMGPEEGEELFGKIVTWRGLDQVSDSNLDEDP